MSNGGKTDVYTNVYGEAFFTLDSWQDFIDWRRTSAWSNYEEQVISSIQDAKAFQSYGLKSFDFLLKDKTHGNAVNEWRHISCSNDAFNAHMDWYSNRVVNQ